MERKIFEEKPRLNPDPEFLSNAMNCRRFCSCENLGHPFSSTDFNEKICNRFNYEQQNSTAFNRGSTWFGTRGSEVQILFPILLNLKDLEMSFPSRMVDWRKHFVCMKGARCTDNKKSAEYSPVRAPASSIKMRSSKWPEASKPAFAALSHSPSATWTAIVRRGSAISLV